MYNTRNIDNMITFMYAETTISFFLATFTGGIKDALDGILKRSNVNVHSIYSCFLYTILLL